MTDAPGNEFWWFQDMRWFSDSISLLVRINQGATDQNIKNKTLASETDSAYGKYGTW